MKYKIDKNVLPNATKYGRNYGRWIPLINERESGDSVLLKNKNEAGAMKATLLRKGFAKVITRTDGTGIRVWAFKTLKHYKEAMEK